MLKIYLHYYINYQQNNWIKLLFSAEFAYNRSIHTVTEKISFKMILEYNLSFCMKTAGKMSVKKKEN